MDGDEILDVDMLKFESGSESDRKAVVDGVMRSLKTGFVYTKSDISTQLLDQTYGILERFFSLEQSIKDKYISQGSQGSRGYTGLLVETAAIADKPDWKEMLNWGESMPGGHPLAAQYSIRYKPSIFPQASDLGKFGNGSEHPRSPEEVLTEFHNLLTDLQKRFLRIIAIGVGAEEFYFDKMVKHGAHLTRAIHYPPMSKAPDHDGEPYRWADEHADINLITALPRATAKGLQVLVGGESTNDGKKGGTWVDAKPPEGHVIINTGILLEHLTNGLIPPGWHRVVADKDQQDPRISVVQFFHPTPSTILTPIPATVTEDRPIKYHSLSADERLQEVIWEINLVEDARRLEQ